MKKLIEHDLTWEKATKNKHVYTTDAEAPISTVYIRKVDMPSEPPHSIRITVEVFNG